MIYLDFMAH